MRRFRVTLGEDDRTVRTPEPRRRAQRRPPRVGTLLLPLGYDGTVASIRLGRASSGAEPAADGSNAASAAAECCD
jgi:hypothetical protein